MELTATEIAAGRGFTIGEPVSSNLHPGMSFKLVDAFIDESSAEIAVLETSDGTRLEDALLNLKHLDPEFGRRRFAEQLAAERGLELGGWVRVHGGPLGQLRSATLNGWDAEIATVELLDGEVRHGLGLWELRPADPPTLSERFAATERIEERAAKARTELVALEQRAERLRPRCPICNGKLFARDGEARCEGCRLALDEEER